MVDLNAWRKFLSETTMPTLCWCNIIALILYKVDMQDVQYLLLGRIPNEYYQYFWAATRVALKFNDSVLRFIIFGWLVWSIINIISERISSGDVIQRLLDNRMVTNSWWLAIFAFIACSNIVVSISLILAFCYNDFQLMQFLTFGNDSMVFDLQISSFFLVWLPFAFSAYAVINSYRTAN
jgi:hypothetical protein